MWLDVYYRAMDVGAQITDFGARCAERHTLSVQLCSAIQSIYACRERVDRAKRTGGGMAEALEALRRAREIFRAAQHEYDDHQRTHQCLGARKAAAAHG